MTPIIAYCIGLALGGMITAVIASYQMNREPATPSNAEDLAELAIHSLKVTQAILEMADDEALELSKILQAMTLMVYNDNDKCIYCGAKKGSTHEPACIFNKLVCNPELRHKIQIESSAVAQALKEHTDRSC